MDVGVVLLAGGKSRRMGSDKANLLWGQQTLLAHVAAEFSGFGERLLSVGGKTGLAAEGYRAVPDVFAGCGPMAGLHAALAVCRSDVLLAVSCDMPYVKHDLADYLVQCLSPAYDAAVAVTRNGRVHPFCGAYKKTLAPFFEDQLVKGQRRMLQALQALPVCYVELAHTAYPDEYFTNINTPQEYERLAKELCLPGGGLPQGKDAPDE